MNVEDPLHEYGRWCKPVLEDGKTGKQYENALEVMDLLNELNDENEQLRKELQTVVFDASSYLLKIQEIEKENRQLKQQKPFLKIIDDYFIQYEDGDLFNLHKPSDIRSLMYILNRGNGYSELQCEYNDLGKGDVE